jgi:outer membrane protein TolC
VRRQYPDLVLGPGYGTQDGERQFQLGVSVALPLWNRNRRAIAEAEAAREVARAALERAVEFRELAFASARRVEAGARAVRMLVEDELLPLAEAQYAESRELARLGEARRDESLASIEVREAIGTPVAVTNGGGS